MGDLATVRADAMGLVPRVEQVWRLAASGRWLAGWNQRDQRDQRDRQSGGVAGSRSNYRLIADHWGTRKFQITPHNFSELNRFFVLDCAIDSQGLEMEGEGLEEEAA